MTAPPHRVAYYLSYIHRALSLTLVLLGPPFLSTPTFIDNSRIQSESSTGSVDSQRIRLTLSISVDNVDFDTQVGMLRISGRVIVENPHVKVLPQPSQL